MITESQLMELKCRMLVAAEAAGRVAERGQDDVVLYNEDEYAEVSQSLRLLASDLGMVFGELDTLRMLVRREFAPIFSANKIAPPQPKQTLAAMVVEVAKSVVLVSNDHRPVSHCDAGRVRQSRDSSSRVQRSSSRQPLRHAEYQEARR